MPKRPPHRRPNPARAHAADPRLGRTLIVTVERIVPGGLGLAHAEGMTLFVALAAPGDEAEVRIESARGATGFARILRVVRPAASRVEPPCPYFGRDVRCGGCDFQQLDYQSQLAAKLDIVRDALRRTARLEPPASFAITPAPREWNYRSRVEWQHDARRRRLGYYRRGTHEIIDVERCPVLVPELGRALDHLRDHARAGALPPSVGEFRLMAGDDARVAVVPPVEDFEFARSAPQSSATVVAAADDLAPGELTRTIRGETYRYSADCFFQINHDLLPALLAEALRPVEERTAAANGESGFALDLYCGVGLFTVPLARRFDRVTGVEAHPASAAYGRRNLAAARLSGAEIVNADVRAWLARHGAELPAPDLVLLDPPRTGAESETVRALIDLRPRRIAYVSCDPVTLARDLRALVAGGYDLESVRLFDLFPQTHHVETVAHLIRASGANQDARGERDTAAKTTDAPASSAT